MLIEQAHRVQRVWRRQDHQLIHRRFEEADSLRRGDRHRQDHLRRADTARRLDRNQCRGAGGDAVVGHDGGLATDRFQARSNGILSLTAFRFRHLLGDFPLDVLVTRTRRPYDVLVEPERAGLADGANCQLSVPRGAELAHHQSLERKVELLCHRVANRHAASGHAEHHGIMVAVFLQDAGELVARVPPIDEAIIHRCLLPLIQHDPCPLFTLFAHGKHNVTSAVQAAQALKPILGSGATILWAVGIIGSGLLAVPALTGSIAGAVPTLFGWRHSLNARPGNAWQFYLILTVAIVAAVFINFLHINPIQALVLAATLNGLLTPPPLILLMLVSGPKQAMGDHVNGLGLNVPGWGTTVIMFNAALGLLVTML